MKRLTLILLSIVSVSAVIAQTGAPYIHDPSTIVECDGKYYTFVGSAAGYGSSFPLNRTMTTELLGFDSMDYNVVYAQMAIRHHRLARSS